MDTLTAMQISGSALKAERTRLNIAAMNLANANTTRTMEGGPYKAKSVVFAATPVEGVSFQDALNSTTERLRKVEVVQISEDKAPFKEVYDPTHPDADANGVVRFPNVNVAEQMVDMMSAKRAYEANVTALDAVKSMALKALEIGR
ncbi:MAG: flagellar basal body rod protein FlgC [Deltaproteobacteria bacterium]|jgi:flagellar basal-body rod protein FlgC|uniref:flagellar basal body rod protein FlgC n=1 Tax=Hydrosulfovibrio ferrireducens TaxID=2934181 RepID=UPI001224F11C|nr:MAG: flagellar basal body rod protein FlgC [Deltaproteobacteria bacterium]